MDVWLLIVSFLCLFELRLHLPKYLLLVFAEIYPIPSHFLTTSNQVEESFAIIAVFK